MEANDSLIVFTKIVEGKKNKLNINVTKTINNADGSSLFNNLDMYGQNL